MLMRNKRCACHQAEQSQGLSRRELLRVSGLGFGSLALGYLLNDQPLKATSTENLAFGDLKPRQGHFAPQAKAIIQLMQNGGPSQMDLFDPKPELTKRNGQPHPLEVEVFSPNKNKNILLARPFEFKRAGQSGMALSDIIPHLSSVADDLCWVRSMYTEHNNHPEGLIMMQNCKLLA